MTPPVVTPMSKMVVEVIRTTSPGQSTLFRSTSRGSAILFKFKKSWTPAPATTHRGTFNQKMLAQRLASDEELGPVDTHVLHETF